MTTTRDEFMQEVETYGNGLLSDETIERTVDIIMEINPLPVTIDGIDIDSIIQAVEDHDAEHLSEVFELEYDPDAIDWYIPMEGLPDVYLGVGDVDGEDAASYTIRFFSEMNWVIKYRVLRSDSFDETVRYSDRLTAVENAFKLYRTGRCHTNVDQVAICTDSSGNVVDEYVIRRII